MAALVDVGLAWCQQPDYECDARVSGTPNCCLEHEIQTPQHEALPGGCSVPLTLRRVAVNRLIERCAMLDIHKSQITACVRVPDDAGGRRQEIREFQSTTSGLLLLADWLRTWAVTVVGMESTGVYWRAVFYLLEGEFECRLYNARHLRHVPGRKSDVQDAEWGCQLVEHGLVRASFVPPRPLRELRDLVRYRKAKIQERTREVQRVEKTLQDAGIKLSSVASEVLGVSARRMLDALISGTHDPEIPAELANGSLRKKIPALRERSRGASPTTTRCSSVRCSRRSTSSMRRSRRCLRGSRS